VAGLKGTWSRDIALADHAVSADAVIDLTVGKACLLGPVYKSVLDMLPVLLGAVRGLSGRR